VYGRVTLLAMAERKGAVWISSGGKGRTGLVNLSFW